MVLIEGGDGAADWRDEVGTVVSLQVSFTRLLFNMLLEFIWIDYLLVLLDNTASLHAGDFGVIVGIYLIYHSWFVSLHQRCLGCRFERCRLLGSRIGHSG